VWHWPYFCHQVSLFLLYRALRLYIQLAALGQHAVVVVAPDADMHWLKLAEMVLGTLPVPVQKGLRIGCVSAPSYPKMYQLLLMMMLFDGFHLVFRVKKLGWFLLAVIYAHSLDFVPRSSGPG
jgi:hypothetical protein